jgi:hypothetical protein
MKAGRRPCGGGAAPAYRSDDAGIPTAAAARGQVPNPSVLGMWVEPELAVFCHREPCRKCGAIVWAAYGVDPASGEHVGGHSVQIIGRCGCTSRCGERIQGCPPPGHVLRLLQTGAWR